MFASRVCSSIAPVVRSAVAVLAVALWLTPVDAVAKTLYVNGASGNDSVSYANNSSGAPWRTIGRAAYGSTDRNTPNSGESARAGDVVMIAAGTYTTVGNLTGGGGGRFDVAYNPINEGVAGSPIRFQAVGQVVLTYSSGAGPMIGSNSRDYIEWSGFTISENTAPTRSDTGPVTFLGMTGGVIENSTLTGNPNWSTRIGDNYPGVRLEDASNVRIANNRIIDYGGVGGDRNHNGIETYRSYPLTIENNEIINCGSGIYLKAVAQGGAGIDTVVVRYNIFRNNRWGLHVLQMPMSSSRPLLIYQNVFVANRESGLWINFFDNTSVGDARWVRFFNNTIISPTTTQSVAGMFTYNNAVWPAGSNFLFWNNIVSGGSHSFLQSTTNVTLNNTKDRHDYEHNMYSAFSVALTDLNGSVSLATWQGTFRQDAAAPASQVNDPRFLNLNGGDYRLAADSPARTLGRALYGVGGQNGAVIPAGAYITGTEAIGPTTAYVPPPPPPGGGGGGGTPPQAPTNLRIIS